MRRLVVLAIAAAVLVVALPNAFTVVPIDGGNVTDEFDPVAYVDEVWGRIDTTIRAEAVDLAVILGALEPDADGRVPKDAATAVAEEHGLVTPGEALVFMVRGTGTVTAVSTDSSLGTLTLDLEGYDGAITVNVYVGPRIPSDESSVRDAVGFISFGDFREQTEYGQVASEINRRVAQVAGSLDLDGLAGRQVEVHGALTIRTFNLVEIDVRELNVVPIALEAR